MNIFVGKALICMLLAAHLAFAQTTTTPAATDSTTTGTTVATTTSTVASVTTATDGASTAVSTGNATTTSGNATATDLSNVTTTFAPKTPSSSTTAVIGTLTDELPVRFIDLDFSSVAHTGHSYFELRAKSTKYNLYYTIRIADESPSQSLVPRSRNGTVFGVGVDSMTARMRFDVDIENSFDNRQSDQLMPGEIFRSRGFLLRNASLVLAPGFSLERETMTFSFQSLIHQNEDDKIYQVRQPVFTNTINTYPLASFKINSTNSQFAVEAFHVSVLLDRYSDVDYPQYSENYDGLIAGVVVGSLCGSFLLVLCIIGIVKCAMAGSKV